MLSCFAASAQLRYSVATDVSLLRNFSPQQKFFALGQTVQVNFHFTAYESGYVWLDYYTPGKFKNNFTALAKSSSTSPSSINYSVTGRWRYRQFSIGWKHYFKGSFDDDQGWNLYGIAGFGLLFALAENSFSTVIDTSVYNLPSPPVEVNNVYNGFKRLTLDLGMGIEFPVGGDLFLYGDVRTWIPTTSFPSPYFHNNKNIPMPVMISGGLRILLGSY